MSRPIDCRAVHLRAVLSADARRRWEAGGRYLADELRRRSLRLDVLFANAGASNAPPLWETTDAAFDATIASNLKGPFFTVIELFELLRDDASVILTSSVGAHLGRIGDPLYAAAKAGVRTLARGLAAQETFLRRGVRVNALSFGAVSTAMTGAGSPEMQDALDGWAQDHVPLGRWANADEAARAALFLATDDSSYMTGSELAVDGGLAQI